MDKHLAYVFPGQGSQSVGMLDDLATKYPVLHQYFDEASAILGYDLWQLISAGPAEELNKTAKTQPALLVSSYVLWKMGQQENAPEPIILAGHSLGEYTALLCAEAIDFKTAVELVAKRGQFMQQAVAEGSGAMAAIVGLDDGRVEEICEQAAESEVLMPANYNAVGQVVIAGSKSAVNRAIDLACDAGAKLAKILQVSVPCHCSLMQAAATKLAEALDTITFNKPKYKIINNVDVTINESPEAIKDALIRQLYSPVRWVDTVHKMKEMDINHVIECGPGRVLCGLIKRTERSMKCFPIYDSSTLQKTLGILGTPESK